MARLRKEQIAQRRAGLPMLIGQPLAFGIEQNYLDTIDALEAEIADLKRQLGERDHIAIGIEDISIEEAALRLDRQAETIRGLLKTVEPFITIGLDAYVQQRVDEAVLTEHNRLCTYCSPSIKRLCDWAIAHRSRSEGKPVTPEKEG